jgi:hypothetical protein
MGSFTSSTPCRVNFEVNDPKPFACLAFPQTSYSETLQKRPIFGDELVTSFHRGGEYISSLRSFGKLHPNDRYQLRWKCIGGSKRNLFGMTLREPKGASAYEQEWGGKPVLSLDVVRRRQLSAASEILN